jgi:cation diffusion facilitator family transporter
VSEKRSRHGDFRNFILLVLLKEGPLGLSEIDKKKSILTSQFEMIGTEFGARVVSGFFSKFGRPAPLRSSRVKREEEKQQVDIEFECQSLQECGLIRMNQEGKYELSGEGAEKAREFESGLKKGAEILEGQFLSPHAAARNTFLVDFFLATLKILSGVFSGSVGLLADGADAAVDTVSAAVVWLGMKIKRENLGTLIVLVMMFATGVSVGYESIVSIIDAFLGVLSPLVMPYLVILTELVALVFAALLFLYQRFVGKRNGSLALISQSVDSKNHIYVAAGVIVGAVFSIFGVHFVDALIGGFIAVRIIVDGVGLSKETIASIKGEEVDLEKYEVPLERHWRLSKIETFRTWILYSVKELKFKTRTELVNELKATFKPEYVPILSEYKFTLGEGVDFAESFDDLVKPLLEADLLRKQNEEFVITEKGANRIAELTRNLRFLQ